MAEVLAQEEGRRALVMNKSNRANSALALAEMALEHSGGSSEAAAKLLLSMEDEIAFDFRLLLTFDSTNRAHADIVMMGYRPHELWPSAWMEEAGLNGKEVMSLLKSK